jgi:hypothetical protein
MLSKYNGFLLEKLKWEIFSICEGQVYATSDFLQKLRSMLEKRDRVSQIAQQIIDVIDDEQWFEDDQIKQNYFDIVDSEEMVSFINNKKVEDSDFDKDEYPTFPYTMPGRGEIKIGKIVNYITQLKGFTITDQEREEFVNRWKASSSTGDFEFRLVSGDDIVKYYDEKNYYLSSGQLGMSCMRDVKKSFFRIYSENPKKVKLLIYVNSEDKILGRAIVWKVKNSPCDSKYFMDRVYTSRDSDVIKFKEFADSEGWFYKQRMTSYLDQNVGFRYKGSDFWGEVQVKLDGNFSKYPFVDTLCFLNKDKDLISNISNLRGFILHSTYGDKERCDDCEGRLVFDFHMKYEICDQCSIGHRVLKSKGVNTSINTWAD